MMQGMNGKLLRALLACGGVVLAWPGAVMSADRPLTAGELRKELEEIRSLAELATQSNVATILESVRRASASPSTALDFYLDAVMKVEFSGLTKENTQL